MTYCTQTDVEAAAGGAVKLKELTDVAGTGSTNATILAAAISAADEWINSFARHRHAVPFVTVPDMIKTISAEEAVYRLKRRRNMVTSEDKEQHDEHLRWLEQLAKGLVSPGTEPPPPKSAAVAARIVGVGDAREITREKLGGYS